jgi:hypothetical protein
MAGSSLFALLDDIAAVLDDVAAMTKVAVRKTSGVLGDDLALNADQVTGVRADRELPVVWAVAKGSARNKLIIVPVAIAISALAPWAIMPLLMIGGAYLCFEGFEKVVHSIRGPGQGHLGPGGAGKPLADIDVNPAESERKKIQGAIRTDLILSAEIIVIALGTVKDSTLVVQVAVVAGIAALMTIGVYGLVAMIVKLDDAGLYLMRANPGGMFAGLKQHLGSALVGAAPYLMKLLSIVGTLAMFMVGGGIMVHGIPPLPGYIHLLEERLLRGPAAAGVLLPLVATLAETAVGVLVGAVSLSATRLVASVAKR